MTDRQYRHLLIIRLDRLHGFIVLALFSVAASYFFIQVVEGAYYRELAENNRLRRLAIEAPRGLIVDRHNRSLVENVPSYRLMLDRSLSRDLDGSIAFAARILERPGNELQAILEDHRSTPMFRPLLVAEGLSLSEIARFSVEHYEHPEFEIAVTQLRLYRHAHQTAHLLGYLGEVDSAEIERRGSSYRPGDLVGKKGIEEYYEELLRGHSGSRIVVVDSRGRQTEEFQSIPARPGRNLSLTLDLELQQEAVRLMGDRAGAIVAVDPRQGEILAMVSTPSFNPNRFARRMDPEEWRRLVADPRHPLQNRVLQNMYPPGSVFKIVMALAALDRGHDPDRSVYCRGYSVLYNNRYRCWKAAGHGRVDLEGALRGSCNVYFHHLGQQLDIDTIAEYARLFGLGRRSRIDLGGEKAGLVPDTRWSLEHRGTPWYPGETISVSTGQGPILVTPLQIAVLTAAVANGGHLVRPHLTREVDSQTLPPKVATRDLKEPADVLSPAHLELVKRALGEVVNDPRGTASSAHIDGLEIAGKTGTAQVITQETWTKNEDLPPEYRDHAWFASFAPMADPRLVVVVFVEHGGGGSQTAAPIAKALYETFFDADLAHRSAA